MEQEFIDLKEQREKLTQEIALDAEAKAAADKEYYKKRSEKQDQVRELDKKISANKLTTMSYKDNIFTYNGETHIIKKERIESIKSHYASVCINYKPIGTTRVNTITIDTGTEEQTDSAYKTIRKILLGV